MHVGMLTINLIPEFRWPGIENLHGWGLVARGVFKSGGYDLFFANIKLTVLFHLPFIALEFFHKLLSAQLHFFDFILESHASIHISFISANLYPCHWLLFHNYKKEYYCNLILISYFTALFQYCPFDCYL